MSPIVLAQTLAAPMVSYFVFEPATGEENPIDQATQLLSKSPDLLNKMVEVNPFDPMTISSKTDRLAQLEQLRLLLQNHPNLDLGWVWLASSQKDYAQAAASLSKAIALNDQIGYYFRQRALLYSLLEKYPAAVLDYQQALKLYHDRTKVYGELADTYAMMEDDQRFAETSDLRLTELQSQLARIEKTSQRDWMQQDSIRRLREEIGYGYLSKALHFIERRNQPAMGCIDLAKAVTYGVEEAPALLKKHCQ